MMFGDFNFSSGLSQLANLDISQKFEQIKKDLEANISSHIDHDALAALTGEGSEGETVCGMRYMAPLLCLLHARKALIGNYLDLH